MLIAKFGPDSEIFRLKALGVVERPKKPDWAADKNQMPFTEREYGYKYKTRKSGKVR